MKTMRKPLARAVLAAALFCGAAAQPAYAAAAPFLAKGWSLGSLLGSLNNRTRIIQFCVGAMVLGLFIIIKKLDAADGTGLPPDDDRH